MNIIMNINLLGQDLFTAPGNVLLALVCNVSCAECLILFRATVPDENAKQTKHQYHETQYAKVVYGAPKTVFSLENCQGSFVENLDPCCLVPYILFLLAMLQIGFHAGSRVRLPNYNLSKDGHVISR